MPRKIFTCLIIFSLAFASCAGSPSGRATATPDWVRDPYARYNRLQYVAAVGNGNNRQEAELNALGRLVAEFGQDIQVDDRLSTSFQEALRGSVAEWTEVTTAETVIALSAGMDTLIGAEIGEVWSGGDSYYVAAILNKQRAIAVYTDMINANLSMINNLTNMTEAEKNTLTGFARYQYAATIADVTVSYWNLLSVIGGNAQNFRRGDEIRLEAVNIIRTIPVGLTVQNDRANRIQGAFARALSGLGFRSGGANSPYTLNVNVVISPVDLSGNPNRFSRIEVNSNLIETNSGTVILPYNFNIREGHTSQSEADNRALAAAERRINNEYANLLNEYLSQFIPGR